MPQLPVWSRAHYGDLFGFVYENNVKGGPDEAPEEAALGASAEDLELEAVDDAPL
jgi:hypothetical protein